ncbi:MAG: hypothetical protein M1546_11560 [Chloroflexi bacterium]|nr:hypothetical protein [Chloroflexota bacterium]
MRQKLSSLDILFILFSVAVVLQPPADPDLWWHLKVGQDLLAGIFPFHDIYSWSMPGYAWIDHEWLTDLIMFLVYRATGLIGLGVIFVVVTCGAYAVAVRTGAMILRHSAPEAAFSTRAGWRLGAALMILALLVNSAALGVRAQMITLVGFALVNAFIWRYLLGKRRGLWLLPVLFCLWANLHGGFVIGLAQMGMTLVLLLAARFVLRLQQAMPFIQLKGVEGVRNLRAFAVLLGGCIVASLINPYTYRLYEEAWRANLDQFARSQIREWMSVNFQNSIGLYLGVFIFTFLWWLVWTRRSHSAWHMLLLPVYVYMGMSTVRHAPLLVLFVVPWVYVTLAAEPTVRRFFETTIDSLFALRKGHGGTGPRVSSDVLYYGYNAVLVTIPLAVLLARVVAYGNAALDPERLAHDMPYPLAAVQYLKAHPQPGSRLFNYYNWGGYLIWHLPEQKVYIDGRMASWRSSDEHILKNYARVVDLDPDWQAILQASGANLVLVNKDAILATSLRQTAGYTRIYEDDVAVIFRKDP